jgi:3-dehydroquinate synthase
MTAAGDLHLDRHSYILGVGGGAALDMIGFAASIIHRGLRLVRLPTTVLAQNDAGIGVKNGMDEHGAKNFVGTFAPPFAVVNDLAFLPTLADEHWLGGAAEAFKVAIITDADFFDWLAEAAPALRARDEAAMETLIRRCAVAHLEHIRTGGDPFEFGSSRPLDFGHWVGHQLETASGYRLGHGQAVAIGIAVDSYYAAKHSLLTADEFERVLAALRACGLPVWDDRLVARTPAGTLAILAGLDSFREHLGGRLTVTLPDGLGRRREVHQISPEIVEDAVTFLGRRFGRDG